MSDPRPIGVFDSGVGGLTVLREILRRLPGESTIYLGDNARAPYGPRPDEEVLAFIEAKAPRRSDDDCYVWNCFLMKRGWHDPAASVQRLRERIKEAGLEGKPIETFFDYIDFDEGRDPVTARLWESAG